MKMKNMQRPKNYVPPQGGSSFGESWPEGEYQATGIKWAFTDSDKQPALKAQSNGIMSARMRFIVKGKEKKSGPYYMCDLPTMNLLMRAFNKEAELLPIPDEKNAQEVRKFLNYCAKNINNSGNEVTFKMGEKFIQWVDGMHIEANCNFIMRVIKIVSKNEHGVPSWRIQSFGPGREAQAVDVILEIIAGEMGAETPWKGAQFKTQVPYGFKYYEEEDAIGFSVNENGEDTPKAYGLRKFMSIYCPRLLTEGAETSYPVDVNNIVPWMNKWRDEIIFQAEVKNSPGKSGGMFYNVNWGKLVLVTGTPAADNLNIKPLELEEELDIPDEMKPQPSQPNEAITDDSDIDGKAQKYLHEVLNEISKSEVFADEGGLTDAGKTIAKEYLTPLKNAGKIPETKLTKVTFDEGQKILDALIEVVPDETKIFIASKLDKLNESLLGFDEKPEKAFDFSEDDTWA